MSNVSHVDVGVDVSKKHLDIFFHQVQKGIRVTNDQNGLQKLKKAFKRYVIGQIVLESTGDYGRTFYKTMQASKYDVWMVEPRRIKGFMVSKNIKAKTDKIDAKNIAHFASQERPAYAPIPYSEIREELKDLVDRRQALTAMAAEEKNRLQQTQTNSSKNSVEKILGLLEDEIKAIEKNIEKLLGQDSELAGIADVIRSMPGAGDMTAWTILALLPELGKVDGKKIASLVGIAPFVKQSGDYKGKSRISGGRKTVRCILYMAALTAAHHNPVLRNFYQRLISAGKPRKLALIAVARKMVVVLNAMVRKGERWNPVI